MSQHAALSETLPLLAAFLERENGDVLPDELAIPERLWERALYQPLREIALRPGKEFRGRLTQIAWELAGGPGHAPHELAAVVEAFHLGSLIIDDIEDGSEKRRGAPALHQLVGVPLALNTGNWLYFWPGVLLSRARLAPNVELGLRSAIDRAVLRCHYGQALDLSVRVTDLPQAEVRDVVYGVTRLKTGSLMELAAELGARAAEASPERIAALCSLGREIGVCLQMLDDLTGVTSERRRHKGREDLLASRPSWVWAWLAEATDRVTFQRLRGKAEAVARGEHDPNDFVLLVAERIGDLGRRAAKARLAGALCLARDAFGDARGLLELETELVRLRRFDG